MKKRERILAAAFAALLAAYGGNWLFQTVLQQPLEEKREAIAQREKKIDQLQAELKLARKAAKELAEWESQSLPSDVGQARNLYQEWLTQMVNKIGFSDLNVGSSEPVGRKGNFDALSFSVRGRGTLQQLVELLYDFYSADHLHQIKTLDIVPNAQSGELEVALSIEALILPKADRKEYLTTHRSDRLASNTLEAYMPIVDRNLFRIGGSNPDATDHTFLTAVVDVDGQLEAWFTLRSTDKMLKLRQGDKLDVGQFHGTIAEIVDADVVIDSEGERWLMTVGENLAQANSLPPEF